VKTLDVNDVSISADLLEECWLLAVDKPLVLCLCLVEKATADIRIEVASHLVGIEGGLKSWSLQELLAELRRFAMAVRDAVDELLEGLHQKAINGQNNKSRELVLQALVGEVEESPVESISHDGHGFRPVCRIRLISACQSLDLYLGEMRKVSMQESYSL